MISKATLKRILADTESHRVELTTSTDNADKFCQAICAFSNDVSGSGKNGYLFLGVHNNGKLSGLKVNEKLLLQMSNIRTDGNILPQPVMAVEKFSFRDGDVLVVEVQPSKFPPVRYRGRVWVRVGPRKSLASEAEEKMLMERRLSNVHTFDAMPCVGTTTADLDISFVKRDFLPKAVAEEVLAEDKRPIEEQLASLGFYDLRRNCPTNGAIVLFGKTPERYLHGSYIQYVRFSGKDRAGDIINEHKFSGCLCKELVKIDAFIETSISQKRPIPVSVLREETVSKYPYWATRELLMNAIMHRDYETNAPVQFYEYDDRIEVQNPGGLYGKVSRDNFPNVSDYRNPFIAEAMKVLGYVNRFSRGVYRVQKELVENGNGEAAFDFSLITAFRVVESASQKYFEFGFGDMNVAEVHPEVRPEVHPDQTDFHPDRPEVHPNELGFHPNHPEVHPNGSDFHPNRPEVHPNGSDFHPNRPEVHPNGSDFHPNHPEVHPNGSDFHPNRPGVRPENGLEMRLENIMAAIKSNPKITRNELAVLLDRSADSIKYNLLLLVRRGIIKREGATRAGKWVILNHEENHG